MWISYAGLDMNWCKVEVGNNSFNKNVAMVALVGTSFISARQSALTVSRVVCVKGWVEGARR